MTRRNSQSGISIQLGSIQEKKGRKRSRNILGMKSEKAGDSVKGSKSNRERSCASREDQTGVIFSPKKPTLRGTRSLLNLQMRPSLVFTPSIQLGLGKRLPMQSPELADP